MEHKTSVFSTNEAGSKPKLLRQNNNKAIISLFRNADELSIRSISDSTKLSKTSVTKIVNLLSEKKLVLPIGKGNSTDEGGKKPEIYTLNPNYRYCLSVMFDGLTCVVKIIDLKLRVLHSYSMNSNYRRSYQEAMAILVKSIIKLLKESRINPDMLCGITIACPGVIDVQNGILLEPIRDVEWGKNIPVKADLKRMLPFKTSIILDNLCRFSSYYELIGNPARALYSFIVIATGDTTGGSIIQHGNLVHGIHGLVGEFGHIRTDYSTQRLCSCGNIGCFEAMVSSGELVRETMRTISPNSVLYNISRQHALDVSDIFDAANSGDLFAQHLLDQVIEQFAVLINNIRFIYDPNEIIIQGVYATAGNYFKTKLQNLVASTTFYSIATESNISFSFVDINDAIHIGASKYCIDAYFESNPI